jgi:glycosyltransferase involved in cell wall biosynthesis
MLWLCDFPALDSARDALGNYNRVIEWQAVERYHSDMEISAIVPFSDAKPYLRDCAQSLRRQLEKFHNTEIIFADSGSRDGSRHILRHDFPDFLVVTSATANPYEARNLAARAAKGRILAFTDADCIVGSEWFSAVRQSLSKGANLATGPVEPPSGVSSCLRQVHDYENARMEEVCFRDPQNVAYAYTNNLAVDAELFRLLGGFRESGERGGDSELVLRAVRSGASQGMVYCREMSVVHLELKTLTLWWRKKFLYGRSGTAGFSRPSGKAMQTGGSRIGARLVFALLIGRMCFSVGRLFARRRAV